MKETGTQRMEMMNPSIIRNSHMLRNDILYMLNIDWPSFHNWIEFWVVLSGYVLVVPEL
jgi:hypothetical protein